MSSNIESNNDIKAEEIQLENNATRSVAVVTSDIDPAVEKRIIRKIDYRVMPCLWVMYVLNYIDRGNIAAARLKGLEADCNLNSEQYSTVVSILFVTYVLLQVPSNIILNRITKPAYYLCGAMVSWGLVSALTALAGNYGSLIAIRLCLGLVEAAFFPGALFLLSRWYTKKELALRSAGLYSAALFAGAFGNLFAAGVLAGLEGKRGIRGWRWLFIVEGCATIFVAMICAVVLPNFPKDAPFLSEEERLIAVRRLALDAGEVDEDDNKSFTHGFVLAMKDPKVWFLTLCMWFITAGNSYNNFFPTLAQTLGYNSTNTLLLSAPPFIFALIFALINAKYSDKHSERTYHIIGPLVLAIVGCIIPLATTVTAARYVSLFLLAGSYAGYVVLLSWLSNTIQRPPAKRAAALAWLNASSNTGNIAGGYFFVGAKFAPNSYRGSFAIIIAMFAACIVAILATKYYLQHLNKNLKIAQDRSEDAEGSPTNRVLTGDAANLARTAELHGVDEETILKHKLQHRFIT